MEARDYGNMATGTIDGITKQISIENIQHQKWERSEILLTLLIILLFLIFDESYYALQAIDFFELQRFNAYSEISKVMLEKRRWTQKYYATNYFSCIWINDYFNFERRLK